MAFTSKSLTKSDVGRQQFNGLFKQMYAIEMAVNPASLAAGAEDDDNVTVPGLALGDMVIGYSVTPTYNPGAFWELQVSAANTLKMSITNTTAGSVDISASVVKVLIGRPNW